MCYLKYAIRIVLVLWSTLGRGTCQAQFFDNFFDQHATQLKNLAQQIAGLQLYIQDLEKGYKIVEGGINAMQSFKGGEFNLHSVFFSSLASINPSIQSMAEVAEVVSLQLSIMELFRGRLTTYQQSGHFSSGELSVISGVYNNLLSDCATDLELLTDLTTSGSYQMTDDQRMAGIEALDQDMRRKYVFAKSYTGKSDLLALQRQHQAGEIAAMRVLYNLNH
jgi:hypothetical protein